MFKLPADLTIAQVDVCKTQLIEFINEHDEISLDDSDVSRIDTVGIQLILAIINYIISQNKTLNWKVTSSIIRQSVIALGINETVLNQYLDE